MIFIQYTRNTCLKSFVKNEYEPFILVIVNNKKYLCV